MDMPRVPPSVVLVTVAGLAVAWYVWKKGGVAAAASSAGAAVVDAAGGVASGAVGAVSAGVGLPTPSDTTTDARVARWLIDNVGWWQASLWSGVPALLAAGSLPAGSGVAPPAGSKIAAAFPWLTNAADYDETDRLNARYPAPPKTILPVVDVWKPDTWGLGL